MTMHEPRTAVACTSCREKKIRCRGGIPCEKCTAFGVTCIPPTSRRFKRRAIVDQERTAQLESRLAQMESLLQARTEPTPARSDHPLAIDPLPISNKSSQVNQLPFSSSHAWTPLHGSQTQTLDAEIQAISKPGPISLARAPDVLRGYQGNAIAHSSSAVGYENALHSTPDEKEQITISPQNANWEHLGPTSWITICSQPGIRWVSERSGEDEFGETARGLLLSWSRRLKFRWKKDQCRIPEPDLETALAYTQAYFDESFEAFYGVVYRPDFETRLMESFENGHLHDDPSWYALRNAVYATGCRTLLAKETSLSWTEVQQKSWPYFENALSVYVELLYTPTGLTAVRALAAMNLHLEGAGNPALEAMMCASAVRLAQSKGLHRQPARDWNLDTSETLHRNWLFWAIYVHEKQVTHRSGRPSAIDDDSISCQVPTEIAPGSTIDLDFLTSMVHHAQISSRICKQLSSATSFQRTPEQNMAVMSDLSQQLESWKGSLPHTHQPGSHINPSDFRSTRDLNRVLYLHFAYYGSLTAIHTIFFFPWMSVICGVNPHDSVQGKQLSTSTNIVVDAARSIIRATRAMHIDAASPQWLVFYYPMVGLINLFLYVLKFPWSSSSSSDVAALDVAVGHFGHLEVITATELTYPFAREVARIADRTVRGQKVKPSTPATPTEQVLADTQMEATYDFNFSAEYNDSTMPMFDLSDLEVLWPDGIPSEGDMIYFQS